MFKFFRNPIKGCKAIPIRKSFNPQHHLLPIEIPYLSHLLKISLMNKLNIIGERGQPLNTK